MKRLSAYAWITVIVTALAISNWSLYYVGRHYGLPVPLAAVLSVVFDGAALVSARISLDCAREHGSHGSGVRAAVVGLAGLSAWLNSTHAGLLHEGIPAHVMFAVPPVVALYLFEAQIRYERRDALKTAGRLPEAQPILGAFVWCRHPRQAHSVMQAISAQRLTVRAGIEAARLSTRDAIERAQLAADTASVTPELAHAFTQADAVRAAFRVLGPDAPAPEVADWLSLRGWNVDSSYVRVTRSRDLRDSGASNDFDGVSPDGMVVTAP